jgi:hypothetical protein
MSKFKKIDFVEIINYHALTPESFDNTRNQGCKSTSNQLKIDF